MTFDDIWDFLKTIGQRAWNQIGVALLFVTVIVSLIFRDHVPPALQDALPFITLAICLLVVVAVMFNAKLRTARAIRDGVIPVEKRETVIYRAYPYEADSNLRALSKFAHEAFDGDTLDAEMVQFAVRSKSAVGLRLTNPEGKNIGFLDVFHFRAEVMEKWKGGHLAESTLTEADFEPIPDAPAPGQELDLAFGAIYVQPQDDKNVAIQFVMLGENYLRRSFANFARINLYASIFKERGEELAELSGFAPSVFRADRGPFGGGHEVWVRHIRPDSMQRAIGGVGGRRHVIVEIAETD